MFLLPTSPEHLAEKAEPPPASGKCERTEPLAASPRAPSSAPGHGGPGRSGAHAAGRQWPCTARDGEPPGVPLKRCSPRVLTVCQVLAGSSSRWADEGTEAPRPSGPWGCDQAARSCRAASALRPRRFPVSTRSSRLRLRPVPPGEGAGPTPRAPAARLREGCHMREGPPRNGTWVPFPP